MQPQPEFILTKTNSSDILVGYADSKIIIGKSSKEEIQDFEALTSEGLIFDFNSDQTISGVSFENSKFKLHTDIKIGSTKKEVINTYGKPLRKNTGIKKGETSIGAINGLFYKKAFFIFDNQDKVIMVHLQNIGIQ